ncbi:MogA/MoaB family molybdenum cofactor biosynthesis protein [Planomicrobium chinense]|uniref:MogA/MoaB family molybdenum cofactor biosynthesis protein n=1 Tax=Planococcus chinensis TaxID=272917 RepID=UPI001CC756BB|nr:MogA/MoaB family molybdenum cofactor biosynthesis protein [Planococcus chinensis]MBZ5201835.1 MogA/MoaB family molybdenum cofactor biosynthesis protein [Planococcus chinensis]
MSESFDLEKNIRIAVLTVSDTRTPETDTGGALMKTLAEAAGIEVAGYRIVKDDQAEIKRAVAEWLEEKDLDAIVSTGGTGIAKRDVSIEAIEPLFEKEIPGFGELFRFLSFREDIGTRALLSRASAGVASDKAIFVLPGSRGAVKLAMERLVLPELAHITFELNKHRQARS